jgi:hypothetical protein
MLFIRRALRIRPFFSCGPKIALIGLLFPLEGGWKMGQFKYQMLKSELATQAARHKVLIRFPGDTN